MLIQIQLTQAVGIAASVLTSCAMLPQLVKILKDKKAGDISILMLVVLLTGLALWTWYGIIKEDWIITLSNGFSFIVNLTIIVLSIKYKDR